MAHIYHVSAKYTAWIKFVKNVTQMKLQNPSRKASLPEKNLYEVFFFFFEYIKGQDKNKETDRYDENKEEEKTRPHQSPHL